MIKPKLLSDSERGKKCSIKLNKTQNKRKIIDQKRFHLEKPTK